MDKDELLEKLRNRRVAIPAKEKRSEQFKASNSLDTNLELPLDLPIANFWDAGDELKIMKFSISQPEISCVVLKRLGKPSFWESNMDFDKEMKIVYDKISSKAIEIAFNKEKTQRVRS